MSVSYLLKKKLAKELGIEEYEVFALDGFCGSLKEYPKFKDSKDSNEKSRGLNVSKEKEIKK